MRIAHIGKFKKASTNGVFQCIYNIAINEAKLGHLVYVYTLGAVKKVTIEIIDGVNVVTFPEIQIKGFDRFKGFILPKSLKSRIEENIDSIDILHLHSVYTPYNTVLSRLAQKSGIEYILTPHGGYSINCGNRSILTRTKKFVYDRLFENRMVRNAAMIHCVSQREKDDSRINHPNVVVINNGVNIPEIRNDSSNEEINILFLGRVDIVHKGLDLLLEGLRIYTNRNNQTRIRVIIAGPSMGNDEAKLRLFVEEQKLTRYVSFLGKVLGEKKDNLFEKVANIFVHTSRWEGLPISILEALSYGVPVFISKETNIGRYVNDYDAGWVMDDLSANEIADFFEKIEVEDISKKAKNARILAEECFAWTSLVPELIQYYQKALPPKK